MRTHPAVAATVLAALAGAAGIVIEAAFGIPTPTRLGVAQPQVWALAGPRRSWLRALAYAKGGLVPSEVTRA